ncbi:hypothetical protein BH23PLA1_BH23PLA1_42170 [soil metagenome]
MDPTFGVGILVLVLIALGIYALFFGHPDE